MAPLPPLWDPAGALDRLPQPYRMLDKLCAEIVERALQEVVRLDKQRQLENATKIPLTFAPHAVLETVEDVISFCPLGIAGIAVCGTYGGHLLAQTVRDPKHVNRDEIHKDPVSALDAGQVVSTSARWMVSASAGLLCVHEVDIKTCQLNLLGSVALPPDPDYRGDPTQVQLSPNCEHVAICFPTGSLLLYRLGLPDPPVDPSKAAKKGAKAPAAPPAAVPPRTPPDADTAAAAAAAGGGVAGGLVPVTLELVFNLSVAAVRGVLVECTSSPPPCQVLWQLRQRPDKTGKSDRTRRRARGLYLWWSGCYKLMLFDLDAAAAAEAAAAAAMAPSVPATPAAGAAKPVTPPKGGAKPATPPVAAQRPPTAGAAPMALPSHTREWVFPHTLTCGCSTTDGTMLAFGMSDGTAMIFDDKMGCHVRILPRMEGPVTSLAFMNGLRHRLMVACASGALFTADLAKPEDSATLPVTLPLPASRIIFLPDQPFALLVCMGNAERKPRLLWYDIIEQKLTAELLGITRDQNNGFGYAAAPVPSRPAPPPPLRLATPPTGAAAAKAAKAAAGASPAAAAAVPTDQAVPVEKPVKPEATGPFPACVFRDSYFIAGGQVVEHRSKSLFASDEPAEVVRTGQLCMYKLDALMRHLLPASEVASAASRRLFDNLLLDLEAPAGRGKKGKRVLMDVPDPNAPVHHSALRKPGDMRDDQSMMSGASGRHITFDDSLDAFDDEHPGKAFPKETRVFPKESFATKGARQKLAPLDLKGGPQKGAAPYGYERPQSPPWHHTNPLARIHPDWEEAQVLARIMDRIGHKGGGRKKRDRHMQGLVTEMKTKFAKDTRVKPVLLVT